MAEQDLLDDVRTAWAEVLDTREVPDDVNFFDVGGDSILLIVLLERLNALTGRDLEPPDLFQHSTVRAQAALLAGTTTTTTTPATPATPAAATVPDRSALLGRARRAEN
jgi:aryl carrier-like protein